MGLWHLRQIAVYQSFVKTERKIPNVTALIPYFLALPFVNVNERSI